VTHLTVYRGAIGATPAARDDMTWSALGDEIERLCNEETEHTDKRNLVAFGPYRLVEGKDRSTANVESMSDVVMLDVDTGLDLPALHARIAELGVDAIVHGTPSDDVDGIRKARVYVRLDAEHPPADVWRVRVATAELLGVTNDPSTSNADRIGFVGCLTDTPPREVWRHDGAALALASLPEVDLSAHTMRAVPSAGVAPRPNAPRDAALQAIIGAIGPWTDYDKRKNALCLALGGVLYHSGLSRDDCALLIKVWLPKDEPGVDVAAGVHTACKAWGLPPDQVSGRKALDVIVTPAVGAIVEQACMLPWRARHAGAGQPAPTDASPARGAATDEYAAIRYVDWRHPTPLEYVVPGLELAPGKVSVIQGFAYTAKTPVALLLALCVAAGCDFLGMPTRQRNVLYLDHEGGTLTQERAVRICAGLDVDLDALPMYMAEADPFSSAYLDELERAITDHSIGMVLIDTYSSAMPATDGGFNDSSFRQWANELGRLSVRTGVLVMILVHENKSAKGGEGLRGISGHGSLAGAVQAAISLRRPEDKQPRVIEVQCARATRRGFKTFRIQWDDVPHPDTLSGESLVARIVREEDATDAPTAAIPRRDLEASKAAYRAGCNLMRAIPRATWTGRREITALTGESSAATNKALARLQALGMVDYRAGEYALTASGQDASDVDVASALGRTEGFSR